MHEQLKKEIESASAWADAVFAEKGEILPMWHAVAAKDEHHIIPNISPDKDDAASLVRAFCELMDIKRLLFISEAWTCATDTAKAAEAMGWLRAGKSLETFPDRIEVLIFSGEDEYGTVSAHREIIRAKGKKPTLGPLTFFETTATEGRFVGMLPRREATAH